MNYLFGCENSLPANGDQAPKSLEPINLQGHVDGLAFLLISIG